MSRLIPLVAVPVLAVAALFPSEPQSQVGDMPANALSAACKNDLMVEPVLNYDVTGSTLLGPVHSRLTVYNNGLLTRSSTSGAVASSFAGSGSSGGTASTGFASPAAIAQLQKDLVDAGAFRLCDQPFVVSDVPLTTVTAFRGATDAKTHTFNYWLGIGDYAGVEQVIAAFIADNF